ncbi:MAG: uridine kinase, partial [Marinirhabdus sp.]
MLTIGIAGGTGSGKTTVVQKIAAQLPKHDVCIISQDSYYNDTTHLTYDQRAAINFDHPNAIDFDLLASHLAQLKKGNPVQQPVYSFENHNRTGQTRTTQPQNVVILEGILILANPKVRDMMDIKIYVHADSDERLIRRLKRDMGERGRNLAQVLDRYQTTLKPMHRQFIEPTKAFADL